MTAEEYLRQSILDPGAYLVEDFQDSMPHYYKDAPSEQDIADLVAFMLTQ